MSAENYNVDLVMLSNFGRTDGGRETWAYNFIPLWLETNSNLRVSIYGLTSEGKNDNTCEMLGAVDNDCRDRLAIRFFSAKWPKLPLFFSMFFHFRKHCRRTMAESPQLVLGVGGLFEMLTLLGARKYHKSKRVLWLRGIFCNEKAERVPSFLLPLLRKIEVCCLKKADILIANGDDIASHYGRYGLHVHVIKNGVNMQKWAMSKPAMGTPIKIVFIGRLAKVKGIEEFLQMVEMVKGGPNSAEFDFHVVGDGPYSDSTENLAKKGMLSYHGAIDNKDLPRALQDYDVCVALTLASATGGGGGTSNALMEQMAAGRVVVAWDNVIFRQLLNEENAYLVRQGDVDGLTDAMTEIAANKDRAHSKATAAKTVISDYSIGSQIVKFQQVTGMPVDARLPSGEERRGPNL